MHLWVPIYTSTGEIAQGTGSDRQSARVIGHYLDEDGNVIGQANPNPFLNSVIYEVVTEGGEHIPLAANEIADNIYGNMCDDGTNDVIFDSIVDYRKDVKHARGDGSAHFVDRHGKKHKVKTTAGWDLLVRTKCGQEMWIPLREMKESHPVNTAIFAIARGL